MLLTASSLQAVEPASVSDLLSPRPTLREKQGRISEKVKQERQCLREDETSGFYKPDLFRAQSRDELAGSCQSPFHQVRLFY